MKKTLAFVLAAATATIGISMLFAASANALEVRDHRGCKFYDPLCGLNHGPVVVVPPRDIPPIIVVQDPPPVQTEPPRIPPEPPHRRPHFPTPDEGDWAHAGDEGDYGISCREGRRIVKRNGFRSVQPIDCDGNVYRYNAISRRGARATVLVNMDGDIVRVNYWASLR
jgi:hypothetical protein